MKIIYWFLAIIILGIIGYYSFIMGWILFKVFVGLLLFAIFALGFWLGTISTKK